MKISGFDHGRSPSFEADSLLHQVAQTTGLVAMVWELHEDTVRLSEQWSALLSGPSQVTVTTSQEFKSMLHPDD